MQSFFRGAADEVPHAHIMHDEGFKQVNLAFLAEHLSASGTIEQNRTRVVSPGFQLYDSNVCTDIQSQSIDLAGIALSYWESSQIPEKRLRVSVERAVDNYRQLGRIQCLDSRGNLVPEDFNQRTDELEMDFGTGITQQRIVTGHRVVLEESTHERLTWRQKTNSKNVLFWSRVKTSAGIDTI